MPNTIKFTTTIHPTYAFLHFEIEGNVLSPQDLMHIQAPDAVKENFAHKGVILSGRGPVWLYGYLVHYYHPTAWVATYDPRLQAAVVVASHTKDVAAGDLIPLSPPTDG